MLRPEPRGRGALAERQGPGTSADGQVASLLPTHPLSPESSRNATPTRMQLSGDEIPEHIDTRIQRITSRETGRSNKSGETLRNQTRLVGLVDRSSRLSQLPNVRGSIARHFKGSFIAIEALRVPCSNLHRLDPSLSRRQTASPLRFRHRRQLRWFGAVWSEPGLGFQEHCIDEISL